MSACRHLDLGQDLKLDLDLDQDLDLDLDLDPYLHPDLDLDLMCFTTKAKAAKLFA